MAWFAAGHLIPRTGCTSWDQVSGHDVQRWLVHLLTQYSDAYASNQFRALQQFFRWLADEEQLPDPMTRLRGPKVSEKLVPVFTTASGLSSADVPGHHSVGHDRAAGDSASLAGDEPDGHLRRRDRPYRSPVTNTGRSALRDRAGPVRWRGRSQRP